MSKLLWKRMLREDPHHYRARVLYFDGSNPKELQEHLEGLSEAEFLQHLEALFPRGDFGPGDRFALRLWRYGTNSSSTLHVLSAQGEARPEVVRDLRSREQATLAWVRRATHERGMEPWRLEWLSGSKPPRPVQERLEEVLAEFPDLRLAAVWTRREEGYVERPGMEEPGSVHAGVRLEGADGGTVEADFGPWPEAFQADLEGWAEDTARRHGLPIPYRG